MSSENTVGTIMEPTGSSVSIFGSLTVLAHIRIGIHQGPIPEWKCSSRGIQNSRGDIHQSDPSRKFGDHK